MKDYTRWTSHGEEAKVVADDEGLDDEAHHEDLDEEDMGEPGDFGHDPEEEDSDDLAKMVNDPHVQEQVVKDAQNDREGDREWAKLQTLVKDSETPLYPGCDPEYTRLSVTLKLLRLKAVHNDIDGSLDDKLDYLSKLLPKGNVLPRSCDEAKKIVCPLGLEVIRYHACPNDCIIYRGDYEKLNKCPECNASRFQRGRSQHTESVEKLMSGAPAKVVWYLPVIPRLKRLFANKNEAKLLRWHAEGRKNDGVMRHPADACQWKAIDDAFPSFGGDPRNIRFGMSTDGISPFGNMSSRHNTWPVVMWMYNLPPWLCIKRKYIHLSLLIKGPKQPGNDLNMYEKLLYEELETLWAGVEVWDAYEEKGFNMKGLLLTTVQDYPALEYQYFQCVHGYNGCVQCMDDTTSRRLPGSQKIVYMGHQRWLLEDDPWRQEEEKFDNTVEIWPKPDRAKVSDLSMRS
jgi:hypothetical protein